MADLVFQHSAWWLLPIVLGSAGLCWVLYFYRNKFSPSRRIVLAIMRFFVFFLLGLLLLEPLLKTTVERDEKPVVVFLEDRSQSMVAQRDSQAVRQFFKSQLPTIKEKLAKKYQVKSYSFAEDVKANIDTFNGPVTDIYQALEKTQGKFYNQNVAALVLASDGIYNRGSNPFYLARASAFPIYSLAFGDTVRKRDLKIEKLIHNEVSYQGSKFPLDININGYDLQGQSYQLQVNDQDGNLVYEKAYTINKAEYFSKVSVFIEPGEAGLRRYKVSLTQLDGETNYSNNERSFTIDVIDRKKRIALIGSGIHPDMGALKNALESDENYQVAVAMADGFEFDQSYDLYILHQPNAEMLNKANLQSSPVLIIAGGQTDFLALKNQLGINFTARSGTENVQVHMNPNFTLFKVGEEQRQFLSDLPPLQSPYGEWQVKDGLNSLLFQKIGQVESDNPLMFFSTREEQRRAVFSGVGLWRWRLYNYRNQQNFESFDDLWLKTVQYLTTNVQKRRFVVQTEAEYRDDERIVLDARLFNASMELTNEPEVKLTLSNENNESFNYAFTRSNLSYSLDLKRLEPGIYNWKASTELGAERFERTGSFSVKDQNIEDMNLLADHTLLKNMAEATQGGYYPYTAAAELEEGLLNNPEAKTITYTESEIKNLLESWWIFFIFLTLLALEWGLRKYWGNY